MIGNASLEMVARHACFIRCHQRIQIPTRSGLSCDYEINDVRDDPDGILNFDGIGLTWTQKQVHPVTL